MNNMTMPQAARALALRAEPLRVSSVPASIAIAFSAPIPTPIEAELATTAAFLALAASDIEHEHGENDFTRRLREQVCRAREALGETA